MNVKSTRLKTHVIRGFFASYPVKKLTVFGELMDSGSDILYVEMLTK